jgi:ribosomal protein S18 acetylase RimI-like enzyme
VIETRPAQLDDLPDLAATLAEAFDGDPVWSWMIPEKQRRDRLTRLFGALLRYAIPRGHVYTTADQRAVAMWSPPQQWRLPVPAMLRAAPVMARSAGTRLPRLLKRLGEIEEIHATKPAQHWYLEFIATADGTRGQGLGSALLSGALQRYDLAGLPVYLESSNPQNLPFYQRHGFTVTEERPMSDGGPPQWLLWRDPA